jgi:hypothetical protein
MHKPRPVCVRRTVGERGLHGAIASELLAVTNKAFGLWRVSNRLRLTVLAMETWSSRSHSNIARLSLTLNLNLNLLLPVLVA